MEKKETISGNYEIKFYPQSKEELELYKEKGKKYWWKLFSLIPLFKYTSKHNYYKDYPCCPKTFNELVNFRFYNSNRFIYDYENEIIYKKARIFIQPIGSDNYRKEVFETNEDALAYYERLVNRRLNDNLAA